MSKKLNAFCIFHIFLFKESKDFRVLFGEDDDAERRRKTERLNNSDEKYLPSIAWPPCTSLAVWRGVIRVLDDIE